MSFLFIFTIKYVIVDCIIRSEKMDQNIIAKIESYDYIAIYRHVNPDFDAFGSQLGIYDMIKTTYPNKKVYV